MPMTREKQERLSEDIHLLGDILGHVIRRQAGIEIFVIDCGWYDVTGYWWPSVGEWMPSKTRFPGEKGIVEVIDAIKDAGMIPGIWIEPEVIGVKSPMAQKLPDSAFFQRHGKRVVEQERYLLDLRDPAYQARMADGLATGIAACLFVR